MHTIIHLFYPFLLVNCQPAATIATYRQVVYLDRWFATSLCLLTLLFMLLFVTLDAHLPGVIGFSLLTGFFPWCLLAATGKPLIYKVKDPEYSAGTATSRKKATLNWSLVILFAMAIAAEYPGILSLLPGCIIGGLSVACFNAPWSDR